jgi:Tfp pilus assembly protein PilN
MLRTNLSTRPFYNERMVHLVLAVAALLVVALTAFNAVEFRRLSRRQALLAGRVERADRQAAQFRADADHARRSVDRRQLEAVATAAREANALIDQRTFSWTELLNRLETTLPAEVRIQSIRPSVDKDGNLTINMMVVGHREEEIESFVERLEDTGAFQRLFSRAQTTNQQGLLEVVLEGRYVPTASSIQPAPAGPPLPARED